MTSRSDDCPRELHDPLETLRILALHHSACVSVYDVCCRPCDFGRGPEEWSRQNQIVFPRRGVFEHETRAHKLIADANHVLFFNRGEAYHVAHPSGAGDDCTVFTFDDALLWEAVRSHDPAWAELAGQPFRFTHAPSAGPVFLLHAQVRAAALAGPSQALAIDEAAVELLGTLLRGTYQSRGVAAGRPREETSRVHLEQVQRTSLFLATHYRDDHSLDAIARAVHCSPFHLARLFRRQAGITIHQYRHRLRLREALARVADGETSLSALALELGFSSHSHFTDAFRQAFGLPPAQCRKSFSTRQLHELSKNLEVTRLQGT